MSEPWLSIIIPAYNESRRIQATLDRVLAYLRGRRRSFEILVVDDGSQDATAESVRLRGEPEVVVLVSPANRGKGAAVRRGVAASKGENVLLTDADLSVPIEDIERLEPLLEGGAAVVCGSRGLPDSRILIPQPGYRQRMGRTFNWILRRLSLSNFRDTQCGFKLFRGSAARRIFSLCRVDGFAFDVEVLFLAQRMGYRAAEVPVRWQHVPESRVHPVLDASRMFFDVVWLRLAHRNEESLESSDRRGL